jgi:hypothetical protein
MGQRLPMQRRARFRKAAKVHVAKPGRSGASFHGGSNRDGGRAFGRKAIDAGGNRWKCDRGQAAGLSKRDGPAIARCQRGILTMAATMPYRADSVNHVPRRQPEPGSDLGVAGSAATERTARGQQLRPGRTMDGAVDAAATQQRAVRRIDDRIDSQRGNIGDDDLEGRLTDLPCR